MQAPKLHNNFEFVKTLATGEDIIVGKAENVVLDQWLSVVMAGTSVTRIGLSTGTGTISPTRTTFFNTGDAVYSNVDSRERINTETGATIRYSFTYGTGAANGKLFTEVGLGLGSALGTHALITDSEGNPITITKNNTEILTIHATVYSEFPFVEGSEALNFFRPAMQNPYVRQLIGDYLRASSSSSSPMNINGGGFIVDRIRGELFAEIFTTATNWTAQSGSTSTAYRAIATLGTGTSNGIFVYGNALLRTALVLEEDKPDFAGYLHSNVLVASGDGTRVGFTLPYLDELVEAPEITVDGVLQDPSTYALRNTSGVVAATKSILLKPASDSWPGNPLAMSHNGEFFLALFRERSGSPAYVLRIYRSPIDSHEVELLSEQTFMYPTQTTIGQPRMMFLREDTVFMPDGKIYRFDQTSGTLGVPFTAGAGAYDATILPSWVDRAAMFEGSGRLTVELIAPNRLLLVQRRNACLMDIDLDNATFGETVGAAYMGGVAGLYLYIGKAGNKLLFTDTSTTTQTFVLQVNPTNLNLTSSQTIAGQYRYPVTDPDGEIIALCGGSQTVPINPENNPIQGTAFNFTFPFSVSTSTTMITGGRAFGSQAFPIGGGWYLCVMYNPDTPVSFEMNPTLGQTRAAQNSVLNSNYRVNPGLASFYYDNGVVIDGDISNGFIVSASRLETVYNVEGGGESIRHAISTKFTPAGPTITFQTPPANGAVIRATYKTVGLYKHDRLTVSSTVTRDSYNS